MDRRKLPCQVLVALVIAAFGAPALAQYQWKDDSGQMSYSDKPPPPHIKPSQIIRAQPLGVPVVAPAASAPAPRSLADREMDNRRQAQEREEQARKKAEEASQAARMNQACEAMRTELRTLDSGMRIATVNANGEREFIADDVRQQRSTQLRQDISDHCKAG